MKKFLIITSFLITIAVTAVVSVKIYIVMAERQIIYDEKLLEIKRREARLELEKAELENEINSRNNYRDHQRDLVEIQKKEWENELKKRQDRVQ